MVIFLLMFPVFFLSAALLRISPRGGQPGSPNRERPLQELLKRPFLVDLHTESIESIDEHGLASLPGMLLKAAGLRDAHKDILKALEQITD